MTTNLWKNLSTEILVKTGISNEYLRLPLKKRADKQVKIQLVTTLHFNLEGGGIPHFLTIIIFPLPLILLSLCFVSSSFSPSKFRLTNLKTLNMFGNYYKICRPIGIDFGNMQRRAVDSMKPCEKRLPLNEVM